MSIVIYSVFKKEDYQEYIGKMLDREKDGIWPKSPSSYGSIEVKDTDHGKNIIFKLDIKESEFDNFVVPAADYGSDEYKEFYISVNDLISKYTNYKDEDCGCTVTLSFIHKEGGN